MATIELIALVATLAISILIGLKNTSVLNGRKTAVEIVNKTADVTNEIALALPDMSALLKKVVAAQADDKITADEINGMLTDVNELHDHAISIKDKVV